MGNLKINTWAATEFRLSPEACQDCKLNLHPPVLTKSDTYLAADECAIKWSTYLSHCQTSVWPWNSRIVNLTDKFNCYLLVILCNCYFDWRHSSAALPCERNDSPLCSDRVLLTQWRVAVETIRGKDAQYLTIDLTAHHLIDCLEVVPSGSIGWVITCKCNSKFLEIIRIIMSNMIIIYSL